MKLGPHRDGAANAARPPALPPRRADGQGLNDQLHRSTGDVHGTPGEDSHAEVCGSVFVSPGELVTLTASGFAPSAAVSFSAGAVSLGGAELAAPAIADVVADHNGAARLDWRVPDAPAALTDAAPRAYAMTATGARAGGGAHTAYMIEPLVAYPGTAPCALDDTAATVLGRPVQIPVLANDTAPTAGSLDTASVRVLPAVGGTFETDSATGAVTFTPDAGFSGAVRSSYLVFDRWGIGVRGDISVTVAAGCTIVGAPGTVEIVGTDSDDVICVPDPDDRRAFHIIDAKAGNDTILGGAGVEWIYAGSGDDTVYGRGGADRIVPGAGTDTVHGGAGADLVYSADFADTIIDDDGYEMVVAPDAPVQQAGPAAAADWHHTEEAQTTTVDVLGNDYDPNDDLDPSTLRITRAPASGAARIINPTDTGPAIQYVAGAGGSDSLAYEICDRLGACATAEVTITVGAAGCTIVGTAASETLHGTPGDDVICGLGGDDTIHGHGGNDTIIGGTGDDTLHGGEGHDVLWGGEGNDALYGGLDDDVLWGGAGDNTLEGNRGNDSLYGGAGDDTAQGGLGSDTVFGGHGADRVYGGEGDDRVHGGAGDDLVRGGEQDDTLYGGAGDDRLIGWTGTDSLHGGPGDDHLQGDEGYDALWGGPGHDTLRGDGHNDQLHGGPGHDTLRGGDGTDRVYGGTGDDTLHGGDGTDHLDGGPGTDTCTRGETTTRCDDQAGRP